ncbi:DNA polymerase III subunit gamma/tau C-terminal domain-containing protein, partial [Hydrogenophaga sp.]|uniref:DNA polymerase III subunit gamma/tau C-terminal domain-containing protein n=1 Tax=Hydrogenophaga sp. TaxID=1904254 RepID=UPI00356688A8
QKVPVTVLSRCLQFNLRPMAPETMQEHLEQVLKAEDVAADKQALRLLSRAARGSMRDALSLTDQAIAFGGGQLQEASVRQMLGAVDRSYVLRLIDALARADGASVVDTVDSLRLNGLNAASTLDEMTGVLQRMAVFQAVPARALVQDLDDPDAADVVRLAQSLPADETQLLYSLCLHGRAELGLAPDEYAALNMVLLRLLAFKPTSVSQTVAHAAAAEKKTLNLAPPEQVAAPPPPLATPVRAEVPAPMAEPRVAARDSGPVHGQPVVPRAQAPAPAVVRPSRPHEPPPWEADEAPEVGAALADEHFEPEPEVAAELPASRRVVSVPVRDPGEPGVRDQPRPRGAVAPATVFTPEQGTEEGAFWHETVMQLVRAETIAALVRELGLQSQLVARDEGQWLLRIERETLNQGNSRERLAAALATLGHEVRLAVEIGAVVDSPALRQSAEAARRLRAAEAQILDDPFVQSMMRDFGGKIVPGSLKAVDA